MEKNKYVVTIFTIIIRCPTVECREIKDREVL